MHAVLPHQQLLQIRVALLFDRLVVHGGAGQHLIGIRDRLQRFLRGRDDNLLDQDMLEAVGEGGDAPVVAPHALPAVGPRQRCVRLGPRLRIGRQHDVGLSARTLGPQHEVRAVGHVEAVQGKTSVALPLRTEKRPEAGHKRRDGISLEVAAAEKACLLQPSGDLLPDLERKLRLGIYPLQYLRNVIPPPSLREHQRIGRRHALRGPLSEVVVRVLDISPQLRFEQQLRADIAVGKVGIDDPAVGNRERDIARERITLSVAKLQLKTDLLATSVLGLVGMDPCRGLQLRIVVEEQPFAQGPHPFVEQQDLQHALRKVLPAERGLACHGIEHPVVADVAPAVDQQP